MKKIFVKKIKNLDEYINSFFGSQKSLLLELRKIVSEFLLKEKSKNEKQNKILEFQEIISYGMPGIRLNNKRNIFYYAAFNDHVSIFPMPKAVSFFIKDLVKYKTGKATIQFPLNKKLPKSLIIKILKFNLENYAK